MVSVDKKVHSEKHFVLIIHMGSGMGVECMSLKLQTRDQFPGVAKIFCFSSFLRYSPKTPSVSLAFFLLQLSNLTSVFLSSSLSLGPMPSCTKLVNGFFSVPSLIKKRNLDKMFDLTFSV